MQTLTTDIFTDERFTLLPFGIATVFLYFACMAVMVYTHSNKHTLRDYETRMTWLFGTAIVLGVLFFTLFIIDMVGMGNQEDERAEALKMELVGIGYNNILELELESGSTADGAEFTYLKGDTPVNCSILGEDSNVVYKVVCFD